VARTLERFKPGDRTTFGEDMIQRRPVVWFLVYYFMADVQVSVLRFSAGMKASGLETKRIWHVLASRVNIYLVTGCRKPK